MTAMIKELLLVVSIIDGDTIKVLDHDQNQLRVRLASIDAPERKQPFGRKSSMMLADFIGNKKVDLNCPTKDRYNRWICTVYLDDIDINKLMVLGGGAWVYRRYYSGTSYLMAEEEAKREKRGLWGASEYGVMPPWEWRQRNK